MNEIQNNQKKYILNFAMAKDAESNSILQEIAEESLIFFLQNTNISKIHCIILTGSLANSEGTVVKNKSQIVTSDFDFDIYVDSIYFLRHKSLFRILSQEMTKRLLARGIRTHVEYLPTGQRLRSAFSFMNSNIYEYEFSIASKCVFGTKPIFDTTARPTREEALELAFTVAGDIVFSKTTQYSDAELSYVYAKRSLTILNSLLIFHGIFAETYQKRLDAGIKWLEKLEFLSEEDLHMLSVFTQFKLSGSVEELMVDLGCKSIRALIRIEHEFLKNLASRVLLYEIAALSSKHQGALLPYNSDVRSVDYIYLLGDYLEDHKTSLTHRLAGVTIYLFSLLKREQEKSELFKTFLFRNAPPKIIMNYLVANALIRGYSPSSSFLSTIIPWVKTKDSDYWKVYSMWSIVQESIKL
jgi:hypothetical protein